MMERRIDELSARVRDMIANTPARDVEKNLRVLLGGFFARLNLVSREEFDVQAKILARAREKLSLLEARIEQLEKRSSN